MNKFFKYILLVLAVLCVAILGLGLHLNKSQDLFPRAVESMLSTKTTQPKGSVKATLNDLNTKSIIVNSKNKKEAPVTRKETPKRPMPTSEDISKVTTAGGAVELSVDQLNVLPSMEAAGSITIHLDKDKEKRHKLTEEGESRFVKEGLQEQHDHKGGVCCDSCAKHLPCESKTNGGQK